MVANGVLLKPYHQPGAILINTKEADLLGQPLSLIMLRSVRDLRDSSACRLLERQGFPGIPSDLYLQGSDVRR